MIIPLTFAAAGSSTLHLPPQFAQFGTEELVLVELQGSLDVEGEMKGQFVGKLSIDPETKRPSLLIGHHLLEGKLVNLPKPLAVIHKVTPTVEEVTDDETSQISHNMPPSWDVVAVVKRKMVFAKRPMPIVGIGKATATMADTSDSI